MATTKDTTRYVFLASRKYPVIQDDFDYEYTEEGAAIAKKKGQEIVALDITTSFSNTWQADVSKYPVSSGSEVSDHLSIRNSTYTLQGIVSDTPIENHPQEYLGGAGTGYDRVIASLDVLRRMFTNRTVFTLFSEYERIDNVVITKISFDQVGEFAVSFSIDFEQVRFAYAKSITLNVKAATKKSVASNKNGGGASKVQAESQANYEKKLQDAKTLNELKN